MRSRPELSTSLVPPPVDSDRVVGCTCFQVRRLARRITQFYDRSLAPCGLRVTQFTLLTRVLRRPMAMRAMADALDMDRTTLTRNLKPLLDAHLVELEATDEDARIRMVRLTAAGRTRHAEALRLWRRAQDDLNASWGAPRVASLHRLFDGLIATFNEPPASPPPAGRKTA